MKRLWAVAIVGVLSLPAAAQIRGVPASVTSITPNRYVSGIPASVTSLGPNGYGNSRGHGHNFGNGNYNSMCSSGGALIPSAMGCTSTVFTNQFYGLPRSSGPVNLHSRGHHGQGAYYPVYVPYAVPVVIEPEEPQPSMEALTGDSSAEGLALPPAYTVFENRPTTAVKPSALPPIDESRVYHPGMTEPSETETAKQPPVVLIYKDGHQSEVQNYAIVGKYLYDISGFSSRKVLLSDLDLPATIKANDERGTEFALPGGLGQ